MYLSSYDLGPYYIYTYLFHSISSANLASNLPYFLLDNFVRWQVSQLVTSFWKGFWFRASTNVEK